MGKHVRDGPGMVAVGLKSVDLVPDLPPLLLESGIFLSELVHLGVHEAGITE
jgi:hypothetical protein